MRIACLVVVAMGLFAGPPGAVAGGPRTPWLGIGIETGGGGVRVTEVIPGTPAEYVGLRDGDEIEAVDDVAVRAPEELIAVVGGRAVGDVVRLRTRRRGALFTARVTLSARLEDAEVLERRLLDRPAPGFALPLASGRGRGALAELAGEVVVVEFMATWCGPCKATYRALDQLDADPDVVVLGVAGDAPGTLAGFARQQGIGFALLHDAAGAVARRYFADRTPTIVVIDARGIVRYVGVGAGANLDHAVAAARASARRLRAGG